MLSQVLLVGLAAGIVSVAIARARIFAPVRARLTGWRAELAECPLCLGFWVSGLLTAGARKGGWLEWLAAWAISTLYAERVSE